MRDLTIFLTTGIVPLEYSTIKKKQIVVRVPDYQFIVGQLYKLGTYKIIRWCAHEQTSILWECHNGVVGVGEKATTQKILQERLLLPTLFKDMKRYAQSCNVCQRIEKP